MIGSFDYVTPLKSWCYKILPLVYDDSLSYYEVLSKVTHKLNEIIKTIDDIPNYIASLLTDDKLKEIVSEVMNELRSNIAAANDGDSTTATADRTTGELVWWNNLLYEVVRPIDIGDAYINYSANPNIKRVTIESLIKLTYNESLHNLSFRGFVNGSVDENSYFDKVNIVSPNNSSIDVPIQDSVARTLIDNINGEIDELKFYVTPEMFGAVGDGNTDDTNAFIQMFASGSKVYIPNKTYKLSYFADVLNQNNIHITGKGTLDFSNTNGGIKITGDNCIIEGVTFKGAYYSAGSTVTTKTLLHIVGNNNVIRDCLFLGGNLSGVQITGGFNTVQNCKFYKCNSHPQSGADWGSIWFTNDSDANATMFEGNQIVDNLITDFDYSGICMIGKYKNTIVRGNKLKGTNATDGMGIYMFAGCLDGCKIVENTIETIKNEGIVLTDSVANYVAKVLLVANNTLVDCAERGIAYAGYPSSNIVGGRIIIDGNDVRGSRFGVSLAHITEGKMCNNYIESESTADVNIYAIENISELEVIGNTSIGNSTGIMVSGVNVVVSNNVVKTASIGVCLFDTTSKDMLINSNVFDTCEIAVSGFGETAPAYSLVVGNVYKSCTNITRNAVSIMGFEKNVGIPSAYFGTLSSGSATVTVYDMRDNDGWIAVPLTSTGSGALTITTKNNTNKTVRVVSTDATDSRQFMLVRFINGATFA